MSLSACWRTTLWTGRRKYWTPSRPPWIMLWADRPRGTSDHECPHDIAAWTIDAVAPVDSAAGQAGHGGCGSEGPRRRSLGSDNRGGSFSGAAGTGRRGPGGGSRAAAQGQQGEEAVEQAAGSAEG